MRPSIRLALFVVAVALCVASLDVMHSAIVQQSRWLALMALASLAWGTFAVSYSLSPRR